MPSRLEGLIEEADRQLSICNACRYCEGYCAVFPALELRTAFEAGDISYLANLCHDCRGCYQACMYTDPHPFAVDLPSLFTELRTETYIEQAAPASLGRAFLRRSQTLATAALIALAIVLVALLASGGVASLTHTHTGPGAFYRVIASGAMIGTGLALGLFAICVLGVGVARYWRTIGGTRREATSPRLWKTAAWEAARLRWLDGGGDDCYVPDPGTPSPWRRRFHHLVAYGFGFAFLATVTAAIAEHFLGKLPPYPIASVPVISGLLGGVMIIVGCLGMLAVRNPGRPEANIARSELHSSAPGDRRKRMPAAGIARDDCDGLVTGLPSGLRVRALSDHAVREVRPRFLSIRRLAQERQRTGQQLRDAADPELRSNGRASRLRRSRLRASAERPHPRPAPPWQAAGGPSRRHRAWFRKT